MIEIDGTAGGGQLLRTSLALSVITGEPIHVTAIRGGRSDPGLRPQHLAAVRLLADLSDAAVSDVDVGADELEFDPGPPRSGTYEVNIGTAGSIPLLLDAVLPVGTVLDDPVTVDAVGGTDVKWSPPLDYLRQVKLPLLRRHGLQAAIDVDRWGFYPEGGGRARLHLAGSDLVPLDLETTGQGAGAIIYSKSATALADADVAERQADTVAEGLEAENVPVLERRTSIGDTRSPGSAIVVRLDFENSVAGFDSLGERGKPAETVAEEALEPAVSFLSGPGAVDSKLADQLIVFLALAGGIVSIPTVTDHVNTSLDLLESFGLDVELTRGDDGHLLTSK